MGARKKPGAPKVIIMKFAYLLFGMFLISFASAQALLVSVEYNQGTMEITYVELLGGAEPGYSSDGDYILAYETPSGTIPGTAFYMPLITSTQSQELIVADVAEQTLTIPYEEGAESLSLYNRDGELLASFDLGEISGEGDYTGTPPTESIAGQSGQASVSGAASSALSTPASTNSSSEEGCCGPAFILLVVLLFGFLRQSSD